VQEEVQTVIPNTGLKELPSNVQNRFISEQLKKIFSFFQAWFSKETNAYWHC